MNFNPNDPGLMIPILIIILIACIASFFLGILYAHCSLADSTPPEDHPAELPNPDEPIPFYIVTGEPDQS